MLDISKEKLNINKLITQKNEIITVEEDIIVPDTKPDVLKTIITTGITCIYKVEPQEGRVRIDGGINTYIMYMPEGIEDNVRAINKIIDFSENFEIENITSNMEIIANIKIKNIESKVINGRKISTKAILEINFKIYENEEIEYLNEIKNDKNVQILKKEEKIDSLIGKGNTKIYAKDTLKIDNQDQLAEILKVDTKILDKDIKISYNKVLTKAETNVEIMYLTEDNRINKINTKIPVVGFIDIPEISENDKCEVNYELKNAIIKPQIQEQCTIDIEFEYEVNCSVYKENNINVIEDLYKTDKTYKLNIKEIKSTKDKKNLIENKTINENIKLKEIENKNLINTQIQVNEIKETKIKSKILYELELEIQFVFINKNMEISIEKSKLPFEYVIDNLENGEKVNIKNDFEILSKDFIIKNNNEINCNINLKIISNMDIDTKINLIDSIEDEEEREKLDYSIMIYIVKKQDTLWEIAKNFGSTINDIVKINNIENPDNILEGQKLFIPKFTKTKVNQYV